MVTSFIQESAEKHIPSKNSRSTSSVPWITPEIRRKIRRRNRTHAKAKKTGSNKLRAKFESLKREIKADAKKQHDLCVTNLVGDIKANPRDFYRYINSQKKDTQGIPPLKRRKDSGLAESELEQAEEFNGQFTDVTAKANIPKSPSRTPCVPCKLLEHIVCSNIMAHLDEHKLLSDRQHAFRKKHSCETQLITVIDDLVKILDKGGQVDTFILDFEKAFDTPPHELLKCKLYGYGISGKTLK